MISRFALKIIPVVTGTINLLINADVVGVQDILSTHQKVLPKASVTDPARSCAHIFRTPGKVSCTGRYDSTLWDVNSDANYRLSSPIPDSNPDSVSPARFENQEVISPSHPSIAKRGRSSEPFDAPIDGSLAGNGHCTSYFSGVICLEAVSRKVTDVNAHKRMNFARNSVLGEIPKFVDLGLSPNNTSDKLNSVFAPATRTEGFTYNSDWLASRHGIEYFAEGRVSEVKAYRKYIKNYEFETMNVFERGDISLFLSGEIFH